MQNTAKSDLDLYVKTEKACGHEKRKLVNTTLDGGKKRQSLLILVMTRF